MKNLLKVLLLSTMALGSSAIMAARAPVAAAAAGEQAGAVAVTPEITLVTKTFAEMGSGRDPLRLNTWQAGYSLKLPLSPREDLASVHLVLETANSTALIKSRSELSIRVNGQIIAQFPLDPLNTINRRELNIPISLLKVGYNDIFFNVVQHYTYDCEDPASPELWTEINPIQSSLTVGLRGFKKNLQPRLTQLPVAFDQRGWLPRPLSVVTGTEHVTEAQVAAAALVVQGLALRKGFRPLTVEVYGAATGSAIRPENSRFPGLSSAVVTGRDVLLVGRRAELSRYMDSELHGLLGAGPFVGVFPANDGDSMVMVVSGNTDEELMRAARSIAEQDFKFSDVSMETISGEAAFKQPLIATPAVATFFSKFDFRTGGSRGIKVQPVKLEFRAPADYGAAKGDLASIKLHFSYGAGLRKDSSMIVKLNGQFAVAVPLNEENGAEFQKYEIRLPAQYIRPGYNTLNFEPIFMGHKDRCDVIRDEGMVLTIYEDSTLELPAPTVSPVAPDLERFARGFWPHNDRLRIFLAQRDTQTVAATLNFVASLAQKNRAPFEVELRYSPFESGHMMIIGPLTGAPDFVLGALPLQRHTWSAEGSQAGLLQGVEGKRVVTAFTASQPSVLNSATLLLDSQGLWQSVSGKAAIIDTLEKTIATEPATETVKFGTVLNVSSSFGNWKMLAGLAAILAAIFTLAFIRVIKRRVKARAASDIDS